MIVILLTGILLALIVIIIRPAFAGLRFVALAATVMVLVVGWRVHVTHARPVAAWRLPANAAIIPALTASGQEMVLNAAMYPVAIVSVQDLRAIRRLNAAYAPSQTPRHIGFLAIVDHDPLSDAQALAAVRRVMTQQHVTLPWALIIDPPAGYASPPVQLYLPKARGIQHVTGSTVWSQWASALSPIAPVHHSALVPAHKPTIKPKAAHPSSAH